MNQKRLAVKQNFNTEACYDEEVRWQGQKRLQTVGHLALVLVAPRAREVPDRIRTEQRTAILHFVVAGFGALLMFLVVLLWTTYSYGTFLENVRQQNYSRSQAQYSDIRQMSSRF